MDTKTIQEHFSGALKHWVALMSGFASLAISLYEQARGLTGIPSWILVIVSAVCFFAAFHLTWLDKDRELQSSLGTAPEVVLEWQCSKRNPFIVHNLRGSTAYHVKIRDIAIEDRLTATFEEVSHIEEGASVGVLPIIADKFVKPNTDEWSAMKGDFMHVLEITYQTRGHGFDPIHSVLFMDYQDRNGRQYGTVCKIQFDRFKETAIVTCEPPKPVTAHV